MVTKPDAYVRLRSGERRPIYVSLTAQTGTLAISTSPTPKTTLFDSTGTPISGHVDIDVSGYDSGSGALRRAWLNLDSASLAIGYYQLEFNVSATGSDGIARKMVSLVEIEITP